MPPPPRRPAPPLRASSPPVGAEEGPPAASVLGPALRALVALVAPPACPACRASLGAARLRLCPACAAALPWLPGGCCPRCALPVHRGRACPTAAVAFDRAWAPLAYAGPARSVVLALKERGAVPVAGMMAAQIAAVVPPGLLAGGVLVPVPADPLRRRRRGVDHAGRLAREVGCRTGHRVAPALRRRASRAGRQARARRGERLAIGRLPIEAIAGRVPDVAILVDDVHTTGATLNACARALRAAGAHEVRAITYARTLR
jgi:predicted amidophosphoribosyltransferase